MNKLRQLIVAWPPPKKTKTYLRELNKHIKFHKSIPHNHRYHPSSKV